MPTFAVNYDSLLGVHATLGTLEGQLTAMHTVIGGYSGTLGYQPLEGELEHFCGTWHWGVQQIAGEIDGLRSQLVAAADAYRRIDSHLSSAAHGGGSGSGSGSGSGTTVIGGGTVISSSGHSGGAHSGHGHSGHGHSGHGHPGHGHPGHGHGASGSGSGTTVIGSPRKPADPPAHGGEL